MVKSTTQKSRQRKRVYAKLASMGETSKGLIKELYNPIDSTNRFINLALHGIDENSQSRQFLLESKAGIKKMSSLLKKLDDYSKKIEKGIREISKGEGKGKIIDRKQ